MEPYVLGFLILGPWVRIPPGTPYYVGNLLKLNNIFRPVRGTPHNLPHTRIASACSDFARREFSAGDSSPSHLSRHGGSSQCLT